MNAMRGPCILSLCCFIHIGVQEGVQLVYIFQMILISLFDVFQVLQVTQALLKPEVSLGLSDPEASIGFGKA